MFIVTKTVRKKYIMFNANNYLGYSPNVILGNGNLQGICKWLYVRLEECKLKYNASDSTSDKDVFRIMDLPDLVAGSPLDYSPYQATQQTVAFKSYPGEDSWIKLHNRAITDFDSVYGAQQLTQMTPFKNSLSDPTFVFCGVNYYRTEGVVHYLVAKTGLKPETRLDSPKVRSELKSEITDLSKHEMEYSRWIAETRNRNHVWKSKYSELISDNSQIVTFVPDC